MLKRVFFICFLTTGAVWGQVDTGVITGSLRDQAGAVIPSGTIKITNQGTQVSTAVLSYQTGAFTSPPRQVGTYSLAVSVPGFQSHWPTVRFSLR
jgi:carboxypeptidase family protein